ncbi:helicase HerA domain-containing protein, partial [Halorubrum pallidum]
MTEQETIHVADVSEGIGGDATAEPGSPVELPVVDVLTGRSFITGKSGSGKSNTASVVIENLLDNGFPVMIVDTDGEYYGLKEEYEILHAGADDECDIVVSPEHAEKLANLALEENVPIILDVSGYLEEDTANELLLEVVKQLFAKEKRLKKPFLLVVEECHEYIPEGGGMDETGKMLIKVGKRGRKHGLGIVGISQRPADVKKDFITQCDWLCWHRLTWDNDTKVVGRILGSKYASAVEDLGDGEAFLMTDWDESIRRIQFHRKQTFDAGATPGLDDFERPELKSVSSDLVGELQSISDEQARRESELADLRQELDKKRQRIHELERELEEARDLSNMADQFAQALLGKAEAPYRGGNGRSVASAASADRSQADLDVYDAVDTETDPDPADSGTASGDPTDPADGRAPSDSGDANEGPQSADAPPTPEPVDDSEQDG